MKDIFTRYVIPAMHIITVILSIAALVLAIRQLISAHSEKDPE